MAIELEKITKGEIDGNGTFDELMRTVKAHLLEEFQEERITGADYANVYLGSMQTVIGQAMQFELQAGINSRQEELLAEQVTMTQRQADMVTNQDLLVIEQIAGQKVQNEILAVQKLKLEEEVTLLQQQLVDLQKATAMKDEQIGKITAEKDLLEQKLLTEEAQVADTLSNGKSVTGTIGKQKDLLDKQKEGFLRDAEQKASKQMMDMWSIQRTTDSELPPPPSVSNTEIDKVVAVLKAGVGV